MSDSDTTPITPPDPTIKPPTPITPPVPDGGITGIDGAALIPGKKLSNRDAEPYFLTEEPSTNRMALRPSARDIYVAAPLIDGEKIFTELETLITGAKSSVLLAYWGMDVSTKLVTDPRKTWQQMLVEAAGRNVKVRVITNDFDPGLQADQHTSAWLQMGLLLSAALKAKLSADSLQVIVANHPAEIPSAIMGMAAADLYDTLAGKLNAMPNETNRLIRYLYSPGVWGKIGMASSGKMAATTAHKAYPAWPASHHQKLAIIDGRCALTGGLNITSAYIDSSKHIKAVDKDGIGPWHDAYVRVEGAEIIKDFISNYVGMWNQGKAGMDAFVKAQAAVLKVPKLKTTPYYLTVGATTLKEADIPLDSGVPKTTPPAIAAQVRRTVSVSNTSAPYFSTVRKDVLEGYQLAISLAKDFIYIENQYLREERIGKSILDAYAKNKSLQVIIVIPSRSEEELRKKGDAVTQYGAALQYEIVDKLQGTLGANIGVFAMERADRAIVYVHSKLLIIDDKFASIGSANANPRSMAMDTELDLVWYDPSGVTALRRQLWREMLGNPADLDAWKVTEYVKKWLAIAKANKRAKPARLRGFVRPFENVKLSKGMLDLSPYC